MKHSKTKGIATDRKKTGKNDTEKKSIIEHLFYGILKTNLLYMPILWKIKQDFIFWNRFQCRRSKWDAKISVTVLLVCSAARAQDSWGVGSLLQCELHTLQIFMQPHEICCLGCIRMFLNMNLRRIKSQIAPSFLNLQTHRNGVIHFPYSLNCNSLHSLH